MSDWIKCSDRMPETDRLQLVTDGDCTWIGFINDSGIWFYEDSGRDCFVTHWQPLPAPPTE